MAQASLAELLSRVGPVQAACSARQGDTASTALDTATLRRSVAVLLTQLLPEGGPGGRWRQRLCQLEADAAKALAVCTPRTHQSASHA